MNVFKKTPASDDKRQEGVEPELISQYYQEVINILLELPDERIAEIWCEMNSYKIPTEFIGVAVYKERESTNNIPMDYWMAFNNAVREIIPEMLITKVHYKNLKKQNFHFGGVYITKKKHNMLKKYY